MLICNVSQRPPGRAIGVDIAEAGAAADDPGTGSIIFATLVDDPAAVDEIVDAYLGEIMLEAASADAAVDAGFSVVGDVVEPVTADAVQDGTVTTAPSLATLDGTATNVTLSNGNLTATHNAAVANSGARSTANKSTGKYYCEFTWGATNGEVDCCGIILSTGTYTQMGSGTNCVMIMRTFNGAMFSSNVFQISLGSNIVAGDVISMAISFTDLKGWFRKNGGQWNGQPSADPATAVGGLPIPTSSSFAPTIGFCGGTPVGNIGDNATLNCGQSAYVYTPPSGFGNWTA